MQGGSVTQEEMLKALPPQWADLPRLLFNPTLRPHTAVSVATAFYQRHAPQDVWSWDQLLTALSGQRPVITRQGGMGCQTFLGCIPEPLVERFLKFLLQLQDSISADSLDRFMTSATTLLEHDQPVSVLRPVIEEIQTILAQSKGISQVQTPEGEAPKKKSQCGKEAGSSDLNSENIGYKLQTSDEATLSKKSECGKETQGGVLNCGDVGYGGEIIRKHSKKDDGVPENFEEKDEVVGKQIGKDDNVLEKCAAKDDVTEKQSGTDLTDPAGKLSGSDFKLPAGQGIKRSATNRDDTDDCVDMRNDSGEAVKTEDREESSTELNQSASAMDEALGTKSNRFQVNVQTLQEALLAGDGDIAADLDFLTSIPSSQMAGVCGELGLSSVDEGLLTALTAHLAPLAPRMTLAGSTALIHSILKQKFTDLQGPPSRQFMSSLTDLSHAFPRQLAAVLCGFLQETPCSRAQADVVSSLCKSWDSDTLVHFLRTLCLSDVPLYEELLPVVQAVVSGCEDWTPDLVRRALQLLASSSAALGASAKYGRLVLTFVKSHTAQLTPTDVPTLENISRLHTSVIRKSLRNAVHALHS